MQSEVIDDILSVEDEAEKIIEDAKKEAQRIIDEAHQKAAAEISSASDEAIKEGQASVEAMEALLDAHLQEAQNTEIPVDVPSDLIERASERIVQRLCSIGAHSNG